MCAVGRDIAGIDRNTSARKAFLSRRYTAHHQGCNVWIDQTPSWLSGARMNTIPSKDESGVGKDESGVGVWHRKD
jgi:hypothetical protein